MLIEDTLGEDGDYETIRNIHDTLNDMIEEHKEEPGAGWIRPMYARYLKRAAFLRKNGVFDQNYEETAGKRLLFLQPIWRQKFQIETPDIVIKVNRNGI